VTAGGNKEELEQRISAALLEGGPAVLLDNFNNITLRSASLDSALTKRPSKVRQFRTLELVTVNTLASVFITGNGVLLAQDTVRRFIPTELDARMGDPERRSFPGDILADVARRSTGSRRPPRSDTRAAPNSSDPAECRGRSESSATTSPRPARRGSP
jgi:hypothetical protein